MGRRDFVKFLKVSLRILLGFFFVVGSFAGQKKAVMDMALVRQAVEKSNQKFIDASLRDDAIAAAELCTDDTFLLPTNSRMIQGKKATEEYWRAAWASLKITDFKMATLDLSGQGNFVYEVGSYTIKFQFQGKEGAEEGKYVVVWKQAADKTWKKHIDIWNSSMPTQQ
jgi:ketosteroid isomerase-like protein